MLLIAIRKTSLPHQGAARVCLAGLCRSVVLLALHLGMAAEQRTDCALLEMDNNQ